MTGTSKPPPRPCVVLPAYNSAETVGQVIRRIRPILDNVIVVDDGSTDGTREILDAVKDITVVRHERNLGKGAALADGFARAAEMGFTHAVTLDADGQHLPADLPKFLAAIEKHPHALIIGKRNLKAKTAPRAKSRLLRLNSNFWVWCETGKWVPDTQSGFRAYPLAAIRELVLKTRRYDFEIEVLVKAMWTGVPAYAVPIEVRYGTGSASHFRPLRDFARVFHLNGCLMWQRTFLPGFLRREMHKKSFRKGSPIRGFFRLVRDLFWQECDAPGPFAAGVALGVFFGIAPVWGFQMALAYLVAHQLRLNKLVAVTASNISLPVLIPLILYASLVLGRFILTGEMRAAVMGAELNRASVWQFAAEYLVGSIVLAAGTGVLSGAIAYLVARSFSLLRGRG